MLVLRAPLAHPHDGGLVVGGTDGLRDGHSLRHMNGTCARGRNEIHETGGVVAPPWGVVVEAPPMPTDTTLPAATPICVTVDCAC